MIFFITIFVIKYRLEELISLKFEHDYLSMQLQMQNVNYL